MSHYVRGGLATVAAAMLVFGLGACGAIKEAASNASDCTDLKSQVKEDAPDDTKAISDADKDGFAKLTSWMVKHGKEFDDKKLGDAVTEYGTDADAYFHEKNLSESKHKKFEDANNTIDDKCPGLGFGFSDS
ncbi:MAG TPA: hypothetical protein VE172_08515 [Stackebrandtia sp.]|jgi:hypothetical protein|uniref:hypothetical protein n=1 Tax=Stackebrandtia sp. TaxID=2023065 RepID=UPI002D4E3000|nr:hypothetical protein [Stackebrandtia sp.]HZE38843.1 hypothetical protein [Stackebrandtia sp.]